VASSLQYQEATYQFGLSTSSTGGYYAAKGEC